MNAIKKTISDQTRTKTALFTELYLKTPLSQTKSMRLSTHATLPQFGFNDETRRNTILVLQS